MKTLLACAVAFVFFAVVPAVLIYLMGEDCVE